MFVACIVRIHCLVVIRESMGRECGVVEGGIRGPRVAIEVVVEDKEFAKERTTFGGV